MNKTTPTIAPVSDFIEKRWSPRSFDANKRISEKDIQSIFEAARWAPSCFNDQPWKFIVADRFQNEDAWNKMLACINDWNQGWAKSCPVLSIILHDTQFDRNGKHNKWGPYDTGAAAVSLMYQAIELGIHSHQMGGFHEDKIYDSYKIPDRYKAISVIAFGYHDQDGPADNEYKETDKKARERKNPNDSFFMNEWGKPLF